MNIFETMDSNVSTYSKTDLRIYETIKKFPDAYAAESIQEIVNGFSVSQSALSRFAKRNGFDGFLQFQYQLKQDIEKKKDDTKFKRSIFYGKFLEQTEDSIDPDQLNRIAQKISQSRHFQIAGVSLSEIPAKYLFASCGIFKYCYPSLYDPLFGTYPLDSSDDVYLLFSAYDGHPQQQYLEQMSKLSSKPYTILVTLTKKHPMRKYFDDIVVLPESKTVDMGHTVMTETFAFLMFDDLLTIKLDELSKINKKDNTNY